MVTIDKRSTPQHRRSPDPTPEPTSTNGVRTHPSPDIPPVRPARPIRVLHVCESFAGGVTSSVNAIISHSPAIDHYLLVLRHRKHVGHAIELDHVKYIDGGEKVSITAAMRLIAKCYRDINPDIVHAHSTYAGVYVRLFSKLPRSKIVYTPHCYSFERTDLHRSIRFAIPRVGTIIDLSYRNRCHDERTGR